MRLVSEKDYLEHHGIKGQKWGIRRYQNPDGTLTEAGKKHYQKEFTRELNRSHNRALRGIPSDQSRRKEVINRFNEEFNGLKVYKEYQKADEAYQKSVGRKDESEKESKYYEAQDKLYSSSESKDLFDRYAREYATASIRDLGLKENQALIDAVGVQVQAGWP